MYYFKIYPNQLISLLRLQIYKKILSRYNIIEDDDQLKILQEYEIYLKNSSTIRICNNEELRINTVLNQYYQNGWEPLDSLSLQLYIARIDMIKLNNEEDEYEEIHTKIFSYENKQYLIDPNNSSVYNIDGNNEFIGKLLSNGQIDFNAVESSFDEHDDDEIIIDHMK